MATSVRAVRWTKIAMMGENKYDTWITSFYIMYSVDGSSWITITTHRYLMIASVENELQGLIGVSIRIYPVTWYGHLCARIEFYCSEI